MYLADVPFLAQVCCCLPHERCADMGSQSHLIKCELGSLARPGIHAPPKMFPSCLTYDAFHKSFICLQYKSVL
ncbi:hypothetical protein V5799_020690 [Amblyomma americanum]|uniref:Uncharacterized protein n=1 Tax=Amblyomma americanum TaxID=6943 RepID=A0AAQ4ETQ0_AMBAM